MVWIVNHDMEIKISTTECWMYNLGVSDVKVRGSWSSKLG
jgi:hypothetical protein